MSERYRHIIDHPHHISPTRRRMSNYERAAQFGSFKALTGFEDGIEESARYVEKRQELTEMQLNALDAAFQKLSGLDLPLITVTHFIPDAKKTGGSYVRYTGHFRFLDMGEQKMKFAEEMEISLDAVMNVEFAEEEKPADL
ncbi:MAG: hypothetical protein IJY06_08530 [Oscillospiraceae bacterium]|nr:hypothetical protein [Oscillospiraceae bacterium]